MNPSVDNYKERLYQFSLENSSKYCQGKRDVYFFWMSEIIRFIAEHHTDEALLKIVLEGMAIPAAEFMATNGTKQQKASFRVQMLNAFKHYPNSNNFIKAVEILGGFSVDTKGEPGRKSLGISERDLSCIGDLYERRKKQGCFTLPENGENILNAGLKASVKAIERKDQKTNVEDWITELALTKPLPLCTERLAKLYTKQRPALIVRDLLDILVFGAGLSLSSPPKSPATSATRPRKAKRGAASGCCG